MKISVKNNKDKRNFDDINAGDVFLFDNKYYMKVEYIWGINCVCLSDGRAYTILEDEVIKPVEAELVIT